MPDIILPNLGLELPDVGSDQDTWGDILNANLEILDNAVTYDAITKTLGAVDVTLTTAEAAHGVINLNGTLTANVNLIVPVSPVRLYLVNNGTTGAFTVTVKTPLGTGVIVNQGANTLVYSDGTNIVQGATSVNGSFAAGTVNAGTLNVSGSAIITGGLSAGAATLITTGNRIAVFGASSVFSANPASPGTLDNVVIGGTTPLAGSFTTLSASGAASFAAGTAALPSITTTGDLNTGRYFPAADTIADVTAGVERWRIDPAGNAGLGVVPSAWSNTRTLQIGMRGAIATLTTGNLDTIISYNTYFDGSNFRYIGSAPASFVGQAGGAHNFFTAPSGTAGNPITFTQALTLDQPGNLGLAITPSAWASNWKVFQSLGGFIGSNSTDGYRFANNSYSDGTNWRYVATGEASAYQQLDGSHSWFNAPSGVAGNPITFTEGMRLTSSNYFKASNTGTYTTPAGTDVSTLARHHFQNNQNELVISATSTNTGSGVNCVSSSLPNGAAGNLYSGDTNATVVFRVLANGNVTNTNNSYGAISDLKNKTNIADAPDYLDRFMQVRFRNFNFIGSDLKQFGVIAQELETVFPGLVEETPDTEQVTKTRTVEVPAVTDEEGNEVTPATTREEEYTESVPTGTVTKSVKYSVLALMAGKVIQEQQAIIQAQQAQIDSILTRLAALEAK